MKLSEERRFGAGAWARLSACSLLMFFNPWTAAQILGQAVRQFVTAARSRGRQLPAVIQIRLPVRGRWRVYRGGFTPATSHSWSLLSQRYAYDLVAVDANGRRFRPPGTCAEHFHAFGRPVHAPVSGTVHAVRDDCRDFPAAGLGWTDWRTRDLRGNYVVIATDGHQYVLLAHLARGSVAVEVGARVEAGQEIARVGNSGNSTEPHLHVHVQDRPSFSDAVGVPFVFADARMDRVSADGGPAVPIEGDFVEWDPSASPALPPAVPAVTSADVAQAFFGCAGNLVAAFFLWRALIRVIARFVAVVS